MGLRGRYRCAVLHLTVGSIPMTLALHLSSYPGGDDPLSPRALPERISLKPGSSLACLNKTVTVKSWFAPLSTITETIPTGNFDFWQVHLHALIKVHGVVTRRSGVFPQLKLVKYRCNVS